MKVVKFLLDHLISANLYLGYNSTFRHGRMLPYISRAIKRVDILNLVFTLYNLRSILNCLRRVFLQRGLVWVHINTSKKSFIYKVMKWFFGQKSFCGLRFWVHKWIYGLVESYKSIIQQTVNSRRKKRILLKFKYPQMIVFLSGVEVQSGKIPLVNIVDTCDNIGKAFYFINANHKSCKSLMFFSRILIKERIITWYWQHVQFKRDVL